MRKNLSKGLLQNIFLTIFILSTLYLSGCNLPKKDDKIISKETPEKTETVTNKTNETANESLFDSFIGKDKEYVEKNASQFTEADGHYIIYSSKTEKIDEKVEVIFDEKNEVEFFVWSNGKSLDPTDPEELLEPYDGIKRLGLQRNHMTQKTGTIIGNYKATIFKDNIVCLYDFNGDFSLRCGLSSSFSESAHQLADNIWRLSYYVDEFGLPGSTAYLQNRDYFVGTFNNSATSKSELKVRILVDKQEISFKLYEYGSSLVKNSSNRNLENYKIIMLDSQKNKRTFDGLMYTNGDRVKLYWIADNAKVLNALMENGSVSFYIEKKDRPTTNYTFTIPSDNGFSLAHRFLMGDTINF